MKYIHRLDIHLTEQTVDETSLTDPRPRNVYRYWEASVDTYFMEQLGHKHVNAERIQISRNGDTPEDALQALYEVFALHGWEVR